MHNAIWDIQMENGDLVNTSSDLEIGARSHFLGLYSDDGGTNIEDQLKVISLYPRMFSKAEGIPMGREVTISEVEKALRSFAKDKSPGPYGWTVEFYLEFFEVLGEDLVKMVEYV